MPIKLGVETNCQLAGVPNNTDAQSLLDRGIAVGTATMQIVRDCDKRPRQYGGPASNECEGCQMLVSRSVAQSVREMAQRVSLQLATE